MNEIKYIWTTNVYFPFIAIKDILRPFVPPDLHFKRIWNKSILKLPVHAYLPKVIGNVKVMIAEQTVRKLLLFRNLFESETQ